MAFAASSAWPQKESGRCFSATAADCSPDRAYFGDGFRLTGDVALHPVGDGVVPEAVEPLQRAVHLLEFFGVDAADLLDRADMALVEPADHFGDRLALRRQADADRTAVDARALVVDEAEVDQLLQIVGDVRAEIVAARAQFAGGQLRIADVEQQQRLDGVDVANGRCGRTRP